MDARLLTGMEEERFREAPDLGPQPQLTNPNEFIPVQPGPVGAQALAAPMPTAPARPSSAPTSASAIAQQGTAPTSRWTPDRKAFADRANAAGRRYQESVNKRRTLRKERGSYDKLRSQLEASAGKLSELKHLQDTYQDIYTPDSPATMGLQKRQIEHFEHVQRLREQLLQKAQLLNKRYGLKIGKDGGLDDEDGGDTGDDEFDSMMDEGYMDALMAQPPQ